MSFLRVAVAICVFSHTLRPTLEGNVIAAEPTALPTDSNLDVVYSIDGWKSRSDRIVGGQEAGKNEYPYMVSVQHASTWSHFCGGSVLSPSHVLTACHCLVTKHYETSDQRYYTLRNPWSVTLLAGTVDIYKISLKSQRRYGWKIQIHPRCGKMPIGWAYDFGIITVDYKFITNNVHVKILPLPNVTKENIDELMESRASCIGLGWGSTVVSKARSYMYSEILLKVNLRLVPQTECNGFLLDAFSSRYDVQLCTLGQDFGDACQGDSGGPLMCYREGHFILTATVSWGIGCGQVGNPGIWARIDVGEQWMAQVLARGVRTRSVWAICFILVLTALLNHFTA